MAKHPAKCPKCGSRLEFDSAVDERIVCAQCGAVLAAPARSAPPQPADPLIGQSLGEFEILELLGRGGMGAVYKARQASLDRLVALKVLPQQLAADASFAERFSREARAAAAVRHPNIIEIFAVGEALGHQYIAMEFIEGETLGDVLKREGRLAPGRALDVMKQTASALAEAHECGILHRDVKPSNILLDRKGRVKVADFGLAKRPDTDVSVTVTGQALGTPLYMPPEAARGTFDARSDLYSLGATFYHALAGRPPFLGASGAELLVKHIEDRVPPLAQLAPDVPVALCRIVHRLLRKNPAERFESAEKLLDALARIEAKVSVVATAAPTKTLLPSEPRKPTTEHRPPRRSRLPLLLGSLAAALVLVVVLVLGLGTRPRTSAPPTPSSRVPRPTSRAPAASKLERSAQIVFRNIHTCITKKDWARAKGYVDRLSTVYGKTKFAAAHRADIAALRTQIDAYVKGTGKPPPPKPDTRHPEPPAPAPDDDERWTEWEDLFDGKTLHGWQHQGGKAYVEDGALVSEDGADLYYAADWTEFALECELRATQKPGRHGVHACGLDLCQKGMGRGSPHSRIGLMFYRDGDFEVTARGARLWKSGTGKFPVGDWLRLRVELTRGKLVIHRGGKLVHTVDVSAEPVRSGGLYFYTHAGYVARLRHLRARPAPPPDDAARWGPWEELFDGKTLKGWRTKGKNVSWTVEQGLLTNTREQGKPAVNIYTEQKFLDFQLRLEFRIPKGGNSGVYLRGRKEIQLTDSYGRRELGTGGCGAVYGKAPPRVNAAKPPMEWNTLEAIILGNAITVVLNGQLVQDAVAVPGASGGSLGGEAGTLGPIMLQGDHTTAWFRAIRLRRLKPQGEAKAAPWEIYKRRSFDAAEAKRRQSETAKALGVPVEQSIDLGGKVELRMRLVPAGEFMRGNPFAAERCVRELGGTVARYNKQKPEHRVRLTRPFWLGRCEVTQEQWQAVMGTNPSAVQAPRNPVEQVSWHDCQAFVKRLNQRVPGGGFRLPTEAEWEAACRAGSSRFFCYGDDPRELGAYAWYNANAGKKPHPVMTRKPNAWGLHDLHGNVAEWCADFYGRYSATKQIDPRGPATGTERVLRNGDWPGDAALCISAHRHGLAPDARGPSRGFRIARSVR